MAATAVTSGGCALVDNLAGADVVVIPDSPSLAGGVVNGGVTGGLGVNDTRVRGAGAPLLHATSRNNMRCC